MKFSAADLTFHSGVGPWGQPIRILDSTAWVQVSAAPHITLGLSNLSVPQFSYLSNGDNNIAYPIKLLEGLNGYDFIIVVAVIIP